MSVQPCTSIPSRSSYRPPVAGVALDPADLAMERYASGDEAAFGDVYAVVEPRVRAFLRRRLRDVEVASDLGQQTFLQMHRARASFAPGARVLPWALSIAARLLIDHLRVGKRRVHDHLDGMEDGEIGAHCDDGLLEARDLAGRLQRELSRLPESQRAAFELMRFDGMSHADAARALGTTVPAVKLRAHRAYVSLRAAVDGYERGAAGRRMVPSRASLPPSANVLGGQSNHNGDAHRRSQRVGNAMSIAGAS
jgi:RNA polymerase sigma-70 factor (ECF subfamily)